MLEDIIAENTAAMRDLIACWKGMALALAKIEPAVTTIAAPPAQSTSVSETVGKIAGDVAGVAVTAAGAGALSADAAAVVQVSVTDVLNLAAQLMAKKGKPVLSAALADYKVKSVKDIAPEKLQAALADIQKALDAQ